MADGQMLRVIVYDYQDNYVCDIDPSQIVELKSTEEINGEHSLAIKTTQELSKTDRLVIRDGMGLWHEYVVTGLVGEHGGRKVGAVVHTYHAVWSLQYDLTATYIDTQVGLRPGKPPVPAPALTGLQAALSGTERWQVGTITVTSSGSASFYRRSGWEGIKTLTENWGGEVEATIEVGLTGVVGRYVDFLAHEGSTEATRRFDYGGDVSKIKRTVSDEVWPCRIVPLGKATETEAGGYTRRPTIAAANGGIVWLEDASAVPYTRVPDYRGGWEYPTTIIKNDVYSDPSQLKAWALEHIGEYTRPQVTYEADVVQLVKAGMNPHGVALGDNVIVVDRSFGDEGLAIDARVIKIVQSLIDSTDVKLTIGNAKQSLSTALGGLSRDVERMTEQQVLASAYQATADYMNTLLDRLNAEINATGGYWYMIPGIGTRTYDAEVSDPAVGAEASKVVEVRGGNIRIADSRTAAGEWDWKTVFQSGHVLADLVTSAKLTAGHIGSADSGNYWDLDSGEFRMASTAQLGSKTVQQVVEAVDDTITGVDVEFAQGTSPTQAPASGWQTQPPAWEEGKYIWQRTATTTAAGTSYSTPVMISGKDGADGTSVTIRGSYNTYAELIAAHPTGSDGDAYMVGTDLYVWNGSAWEDVGQIQGPQGPAGTSVTVSSIQYGTSASASTTPSNWVTTPPTSIAAGRWLWVRTNYSNGSTATTKSYVGTNGTSVYVQSTSKVDGVTTIVLANTDGTTSTIRIADGEDGATGQRGPAGADGESTYIHTAWANSQDGTTDFSTTVSAGKSYLGVCTDGNAADPTTPSSYSWSKIEGAAGADGKGVSSVTEQYYLSTSSSTQSGGAWATSPAAYVTGRFYWTRSITTYTDNTAVISEPVLARGLNSANKTAADALGAVNDLSTQEAIFNLLTNNGALQGLYMSNSQLYINGTYMKIGKISSANGRVYFDLDNNELRCDKLVSTDSTNNVIAQIGKVSLSGGGSSTRTYTGQLVYSGSDQTNGILLHPGSSSAVPTITSPSNRIRIECIANQGGGFGYGYPGIIVTKNGYTVVHGATRSLSESSAVSSTANNDAGRVICHPAYTGSTGSSSYTMDGKVEINGSLTATRFPTRLSALTVTGTKSRSARTDNYGDRLLYCDETPSPTFTDFGGGRTDEDGLCYVEIDGIFAETVRTDMAYQVFLQKCGQGDLWVDEKTPTYFIVHGTPNLAFDWQLKARQKDYETMRLEDEGIDDALADRADFFAGSMEEAMLADLGSIIESIEDAYEMEEANEAA